MTQDTHVSNDQLDAELELLIGDATSATTATTEATVATESPVIDLEQIEAQAHAQAIKEEAYSDQEPEVSDGITTRGKGKGKKAASTPTVPRASRAAGATASSMLAQAMNDEQILKAAALVAGDPEDTVMVSALKANIDKLAKKVGDKAVNLLKHQGEPKKLQHYTRLGLQYLAQHGAASSILLTKHFQDNGYTIGTARSQANQLMALFPTLKVAEKSGKNLTLNKASSIVASFQAAAA